MIPWWSAVLMAVGLLFWSLLCFVVGAGVIANANEKKAKAAAPKLVPKEKKEEEDWTKSFWKGEK